MTKIDRRDFLLHVAPLVAAPALILGSVSEMEAQIKNFALRTPTNNAQVSVGQTVQISLALIKTAYPRISRIDFKANGQMIGTSSTRPHQMNWQPTQAGNFALTAEAVLSNGTIVTTPTVNVAVATSQLEVLYDTLGNATDGWGWAGQTSYTSTFSDALSTSYVVVTNFIGSISAPKRIRGIEIAGNARNSATGQNLPMSYFNNNMWFGVWNANVQSFHQSPLGGSVVRMRMPVPNLGSTSVPVTIVGGTPIYVFGWDNLDIPLPANAPLEMSLQFERLQVGDIGGVFASSIPGPNMLRASNSTGNGTIGQPMAVRLKVSN